jgi:hypothetical protein
VRRRRWDLEKLRTVLHAIERLQATEEWKVFRDFLVEEIEMHRDVLESPQLDEKETARLRNEIFALRHVLELPEALARHVAMLEKGGPKEDVPGQLPGAVS